MPDGPYGDASEQLVRFDAAPLHVDGAPPPDPVGVVSPVTGPRGPTADAVTEERMLRPREGPPARGWRRALYRSTGGLVNAGPGAADLRSRGQIAAIKTRIAGSRTIAVVSTKGGVGKTTTTATLGHTFATYRGDRVVALDGNPDAGSLGYRVPKETIATADHLLAEAESVCRYSDIRAFTSQSSSRLEVVASPDDPGVSQALGEGEYRRLISLLQHYYNLILVDCGTGILDSATRGIVDVAEQIVVVTSPSLDSARATSYLLDWLESHGFGELVSEAVAVISAVPARTGAVDVDEVERHFTERCRRVVRIPWDPYLAAGAGTSLEDCRPATRDAYRSLAAAVAEGFTIPARTETGQ